MSQWGQQPGFQYPMQTGFPGQNPQFQQQNPQFQQQNPQFQQGFNPAAGGLVPQRTGFPGQPQGMLQPQQTGFPGSGFLQAQPTGFPGMQPQQQMRPAPAPPVPPIPSQFQQQNQGSNMLSPPNQANRFLSPSPSMGQSPMQARPLVPQVTGYVDPRLQMMSSTFMPINTSMPYNAGGAPQLPSQTLQGGLNLQQSFQQHNQAAAPPRVPWALSKAEKKSYDSIFRAWDTHNTGFISGQTALEVFGQSGLSKDDLARIWTLADVDDRGKLNIAEFHVAMGLIYRRLNGNDIPDKLPPELIPPSARDLGEEVDRFKEMLKNETRPGSSQPDGRVSYAKNRSFHSSSPHDPTRDATIYKHDDSGSSDSVYKPRSRHVDRSMVRSKYEQGTAGDLAEVKNILDNTSHMLDKAAEDEASRTAEDEALDREMEDLRYKVRRLQEDLDYASRGPRSAAKDDERRKLERELLNIKHEKVPELERKMKARDERREREKRQWVRDRDRANERFGRYSDRDRDRDDYYSGRYDDRDRDRPYSRGPYDDRDRDRDRDWERERERERDRERDRDRDYDRDYRRRSRSRDGGYDRDYDRPRSPPRTRTPPAAPPPPAASSPSASREPPPKPTPSPAPNLKNMTAAERQAYARAEAQRRIEERKARLGLVATPSPAAADTSVEDRLQQEKKAAEEKALAAEKEAEEREKMRRERLEREKAFKEGRDGPSSSPTVETPATTAPPAPTPRAPPAPTPKAAPPPPAPKKAPPPPKPRSVPKPPPVQPPAPVVPEVDPEEEAFRAREEALRKQREERAARLRELERQEEEARLEDERMNARMAAMRKPSVSPAPSPVAPQVVSSPPIAPPVAPRVVTSPPVAPPAPTPRVAPQAPVSAPTLSPPIEKSNTNPFSRLINQSGGGGSAAPTPSAPPAANTNPWTNATAAPAAPVAPTPPAPARSPVTIPTPTRSPGPKAYNTAPAADPDDWDVIEKNDDSDDSDDEIQGSRSVRNEIANKLFGNLLPRPQSTGSGPSSPASPAPPPPPPPPSGVPGAPMPPPPPPAPAAPPPPAFGGAAPSAPAATGDRSALLSSIQLGARLRPTKTVDKSGPQTSGKVLGDTAPPSHINTAAPVAREPSPPPPAPPAPLALPETIPMAMDSQASSSTSSNNPTLDRLPSTREEEYESSDDDDEGPESLAGGAGGLPGIHVEAVGNGNGIGAGESDLMADIDKTKSLRVRSLYAFEGDGPDDLSFAENLMLIANPSKTGGDWWYGKLETSGKSGLFPKTYVEEVTPVKAKAIFTYNGENPDELSVAEGDIITIVDQSEDAWWKAERDGMVFIVPAAYLEVVEG